MVNDFKLFILLVIINFGFLDKIIDVKTVLLYGDLDQEIHMKCPQGMFDIGKDDQIILNKCIYSLLQAAS